MKAIFIAILLVNQSFFSVSSVSVSLPRYRQLMIGPIRVKCRLKHEPKPSYAPSTSTDTYTSTYESPDSKTEKEQTSSDEEKTEDTRTIELSLKHLYKSGLNDGYVEGFLDGKKTGVGYKFRNVKDSLEDYRDDKRSFRVADLKVSDHNVADTLNFEGTKVIAEIYKEALKQAIDLVRKETLKDEYSRYSGSYRDRSSRYKSKNARLRGYNSVRDRSFLKFRGDNIVLDSQQFQEGRDPRLTESLDGEEHYHHIFSSDDKTDMDFLDYFLGINPEVVVTETSEISDNSF